ncbi:PaaI family thioesterase [Ideonella sp. BN130291]|uniref:PaaI family thioesterase n=1 Tax=Ideonella sp. BN130291 TaxID=3112940 RepID=UPI002E2668ED|nr:PaaI family thioesterase [Ideonella sp. BN130291]
MTDVHALQRAISEIFAPWVQRLNLRVLAAQPGEIELALPVGAEHVHAGGVMCGQTLMSAADTAMVLAIMTQLGEFKPMTTVQLQTSFLRPIAAGTDYAKVVARVLRRGRNLVFGEIEVSDATGKLAAHATTTYALL